MISQAIHPQLPVQEPFRPFFDRHPDPMWIVDGGTGVIVAANDASVRAFGFSRAAMAGARMSSLCPDAGDGPLDGPRTFFRVDGEPVEVDVWSYEVDFHGRAARVVLTRDLSAKRRALRALEESELRFRAAMEHAPIGMALVGLDGRWLEVNRALCRLIGYSEEELRATDFQHITHPDDLYRDLAQVGRLLEGQSASYEMEKRYLRKDGSVVWILLTASLVRDAEGRPLHFVSQIQDISGRRQAQAALQAYARELERSNRELADFAYVASHDLQEPLRKIQAFGGRLADHAGAALDETGRDWLARMQGAAERMSHLIHDLLAYSRVGTRPVPFASVDLAQAARDAVSDLSVRLHSTGGAVEIGALPCVEGDGRMMRQLLLNLVGNGVKFHRPGVPPVVHVHGRLLDADEAPPTAEALAWAELVVRDNGIGFEQKHAERIFSPFQRLHGRGEYEGTGMGLAICRRIAERHGGTLTAAGQPGAGSAFTLRIPARRPPPLEEP